VLFDKGIAALIQYPSGATNNNYVIPSSVTSIGSNAFYSCTGLASVTIPDGVTNIGSSAFELCSGLTNVTVPQSVTSIGAYAFSTCGKLTSAFFLGNAPSVNGEAGEEDTSVFYSQSGTVYYLPGTIGWGSTFGGWPTTQWDQAQPQILGLSGALGSPSNGFDFTISWVPNVSVVVLASTNLQAWTPVITNTPVSGTSSFYDASWTNYPLRFYRVVTR
jgi:hypothetical protein